MEGLEVELVLRLLAYDAQIRPQCGLCDRLGIVVVVLLSLYERLHIDRRDDPRLVTQMTQRPVTKWALRHASMPTTLGGSRLKVSRSARRLILRRKAILPSVPKPTTWKTSLPISMPIEAKGVCGGVHGLLLRMLRGSLCRLSPRGEQPVHPISRRERLSACYHAGMDHGACPR